MTTVPDSFAHLAVVPFVVNGGAALLPAIVAGSASVAAVVCKPRTWVRLCRTRPWASATTLLIVALLIGALTWWLTRPVAPGRSGPPVLAHDGIDWTKVALQLLAHSGKSHPDTDPTTMPTPDHAVGFRWDAARSGYVGGRAPVDLAETWNYYEEPWMYLSSPVVYGNRLYSAAFLPDATGGYGAIFCLDAATGHKIWLTDLKDPKDRRSTFKGFFSSPALTADGRTLVIGQGLHTDANCELIGLDTASGDVRWLVKTPLHLESSPAIEGDLAVIGAGAIEQGDDHKPVGDPAGIGHPGFVLAVRISTGQVAWRHTVNDPESAPLLVDGVVYVGSGLNGSAVVALRSAADEELKQQNLPREMWRTPTPYPAWEVTLTDQTLLVGCGKGDFAFAARDPAGAVVAVDRATGRELWRAELPDAVLAPIAVRNGRAFVPLRNGELVALDLKERGRVLWRQRISGQCPVLAGAAVTDEHVYAVSNDGTLAVLKFADGQVVQRYALNARERPGDMGFSTSSPLIVGGRLYVGSETGGLRCYVNK